MYQKLIEYFESRSVLILGFGREGRSTYAFIRKYYPDKPLGVADIKRVDMEDENVRVFSGDGYLDAVKRYDLIMQSPGISMRDVKIPDQVEISGQVDLFLRFVACETIGITGTKGKTTTSSLIYEMLLAAQKPACLIGNIGVPVFNSLADIEGKTAVIEMSSHQLEFAKASPHIAVFTNIYEEHLDHYRGFNEYVNAKLNILRYQNERDFYVYNADQGLNGHIDQASLKAKGIPVREKDGETNEFFRSLTGANDRLIGKHNRYNIFFAAAAARCLGVDNESILRGIRNFEGIEHRMEPVGIFRGIRFFNDSIATVPVAVISAIEAIGDVETLIIGGKDRGIDYTGLISDLTKSGIKNLICLPETGHTIGAALAAVTGKIKVVFAADMEQAVKSAFELTHAGHSCLLSPAASSYNRYKDFEEKGRHFKALVRELGAL